MIARIRSDNFIIQRQVSGISYFGLLVLAKKKREKETFILQKIYRDNF